MSGNENPGARRFDSSLAAQALVKTARRREDIHICAAGQPA
jgi:hypothetical protein